MYISLVLQSATCCKEFINQRCLPRPEPWPSLCINNVPLWQLRLEQLPCLIILSLTGDRLCDELPLAYHFATTPHDCGDGLCAELRRYKTHKRSGFQKALLLLHKLSGYAHEQSIIYQESLTTTKLEY